MSHQSFEDLGISPAVRQALSRQGIEEPFAIQKLVIADALAGHDMLVKSPTGSGKTLAFAAPMVDRIEADERRPAGLVIAPTRELALQILDDIRPLAQARALAACAVYGGAGIQKQAKLARRSHILVATPGRLLDLIGRGDVSLERVRILVLDEADRMLDMGFRPDVDRIVSGTSRWIAKRCCSRPRSRARSVASPTPTRARRASTPTLPPGRRRGSSTASSGSRTRASSTPSSRSCETTSAAWR